MSSLGKIFNLKMSLRFYSYKIKNLKTIMAAKKKVAKKAKKVAKKGKK